MYTPSLTGSWSVKYLWTSSKNTGHRHSVRSIIYADGYWIACGNLYESTYRAQISYATNITGTWNTKDLWSCKDHRYFVGPIAYADGYLVTCGKRGDTAELYDVQVVSYDTQSIVLPVVTVDNAYVYIKAKE